MEKDMNYTEDELIPLSALQHYVFCERQCALIHIEQIWEENKLTAEGRIMHERVHEVESESRGDVRIERGVPLRSLRLGLIGKADVVEFHKVEGGLWQPFPVEYKHGKPKPDRCDEVQLCAQAMCLEEMMEFEVIRGALFYGKTRHRHDVTFDTDLRKETADISERAIKLIASGLTPKPVFSKKCKQCSLIEFCMPKSVGRSRAVEHYLAGAFEE